MISSNRWPAPPHFTMHSTGKLVILGILTVALASAAASWWFRYAATHRAAEFWGPHTAQQIRDAPVVEFFRHDRPSNSAILADEFRETLAVVDPAHIRNITGARGLVHLRNALVEDRSYNWPPQPPRPDTRWEWVLHFRPDRKNEGAMLLFSSDCAFVATLDRPQEVLSCKIAAGLDQMFAEFTQLPAVTTPTR